MYFSLFRFLFQFNYCFLTTLVSFRLCLVYFTTVWRPECGYKRLLPIRSSRFTINFLFVLSYKPNFLFVVRIVPIFSPKCRDILQQQGALKKVRVNAPGTNLEHGATSTCLLASLALQLTSSSSVSSEPEVVFIATAPEYGLPRKTSEICYSKVAIQIFRLLGSLFALFILLGLTTLSTCDEQWPACSSRVCFSVKKPLKTRLFTVDYNVCKRTCRCAALSAV